MDFFSNKDEKDKPTSDRPNDPPKQSKSELLHSAKVVAEALKSQDFDKAKVAGAAADLLNAASQYGKLDDKEGMGKYADMAETYLRKYHGSNSTTTADPHHSTATATTETTHTSANSDGHSKYGEYIKMAEGMLKKHSGSASGDGTTDTSAAGHGHSGGGGGGGGYGEYMKMAGDFIKKH